MKTNTRETFEFSYEGDCRLSSVNAGRGETYRVASFREGGKYTDQYR